MRGALLTEIWLDGVFLGRIAAVSFRPGLLAAGIGHGHYGFHFQIKSDHPPHGMLELREAATNQILTRRRLTGAGAAPASAVQTVESLLGLDGQWRWTDLWSAAAAFDFESDLRTHGDRRFVAVVFWFLRARWPSEDEYAECLGNLRRRVWSARALFLHVLGGCDARHRQSSPPSPYDGGFPFRMHEHDAAAGATVPAVDFANCLAAADLVSPPWPEKFPELKFDDKTRRLLCHPPAHGITLAVINHIVAAAPCQIRLLASLDHARSNPVEFAIVLAPKDASDHEMYHQLLAREGSDAQWHRLASGESRTLLADRDAGADPVKLYVATRMATDAQNNYFSWAHLSSLSVTSGTTLRKGSASASKLKIADNSNSMVS